MLWWFFFWREDSGGWKEKIMIRIMLVSPYADTKDRGESSCDIWWWRSRQLFKGNKDTAVSIILIDKLIFSLKSSPGRLGTFFLKIFKKKREKSRVLENRRKKWRNKSEQLLTTHSGGPLRFFEWTVTGSSAWLDRSTDYGPCGFVAGRCAPEEICNLSPFPFFSNRFIFFKMSFIGRQAKVGSTYNEQFY